MNRITLAIALAVAACGGSSGPCAPDADLAVIEARYHAELLEHCGGYAPLARAEDCPAFAEVTDRARRARERWAACQR